MTLKLQIIFVAAIVLILVSASAAAEKGKVSDLPDSQQWLNHLNRDLLSFWANPEGLGDPIGNFNTFRYDDGSPVNPLGLLREPYLTLMNQGHTWITDHLNKQYVRMISRQTYAFGVAFHLTGDVRYLNLAKSGVDFILTHAQESSGAFVSWFENGKPQPSLEERTSQDMAFALTGPSFYYYLTRDPDVLEKIIKAKKFFFDTYGGTGEWSYLKWNLLSDKDQRTQPIYLGAQVDLLPSYMILMFPLLPEHEKTIWKDDLKKLANILQQQFYNKKLNVFWGRLDDPNQMRLGGYHVDFGYTSRTFRALWLIGKLLKDQKLIDFSEQGAIQVFKDAYLPDIGAWGERINEDGSVRQRRMWWTAAELDVTAAYLALHQDTLIEYLVSTYNYWFTNLVDKKGGSVWYGLDENGKTLWTKANLWKSAFHEFEHALVGYISSQALKNQSVILNYAFINIPEKSQIQPYQLQGTVTDIKSSDHPELSDRSIFQVKFDQIH